MMILNAAYAPPFIFLCGNLGNVVVSESADAPFFFWFFFATTGVAISFLSVGGKPLSGCDEARASSPCLWAKICLFPKCRARPCAFAYRRLYAFLTFSYIARLFCDVRLKNVCKIFLK